MRRRVAGPDDDHVLVAIALARTENWGNWSGTLAARSAFGKAEGRQIVLAHHLIAFSGIAVITPIPLWEEVIKALELNENVKGVVFNKAVEGFFLCDPL